MRRECLLSISSFLVSTAVLGIFFFNLPLELKGKVFLTLAPLLLALLGLIGWWSVPLWLAFVFVIWGPMILLPKMYPLYLKLVTFAAVFALMASGYKNARECLLILIEHQKKKENVNGRLNKKLRMGS
ncbi:hypothetical protein [Thermococcus sp. Bubb.Bath]|uniref:hypothetical protein n=1 Tax=Thermococcus sp. Bubb.Bath TaxID=1638242 RepID=UPI00143AC6BE|nr:hypothetical protein [Thermococcus sp. Bubb.Bath]